MLKKFIIICLFFTNITYICFAQPQDEAKMKKAEAIQIAYLTKELGLSSEEAQKFWPVFNNYKEELKRARLDNSKDEIQLEEKVVNIRKKYKPDFRKVLGNDDRVNTVFVADKNFREILKKELINRKQNGGNNNRLRPGGILRNR